MPKRITEEELIEELQRLDDLLDSSPRASDMTELGEYGENTYLRRFGSWNNALREADIKENKKRNISRDELVSELRRLYDKFDQVPSSSLMNKKGKYSEGPYLDRFGSWNEALEEVGIDPIFHQNISKDELREELFRLKEFLGHVPRYEEVEEHGLYGKSTFERYFGSWNDALEEVGFTLNKLRDGNRRSIKYGQSWSTPLKRKVLLRDDYRCQACFSSENKLGQKPDIHHIKPVKHWNVEREHEEMNSPENLICLCRSCHRRFQSRWMDCDPDVFSIKARSKITD